MSSQPSSRVAQSEFSTFPKIDAHVHYNTLSLAFAEQAAQDGFKCLVSLCADIALAGWPYVEEQHRVCTSLQERISKAGLPLQLQWACSFHTDGFSTESYPGELVRWVDKRVNHDGAKAVKFWKNVGMELRDEKGEFVFISHEKFHPLFHFMSENNIPLACHCGEPRNCWLPVEAMTVNNDAEYFSANGKYHMYLHPEYPSYEAQVNARDDVLRMFPKLSVMGAHLGSLEWSVEQLGQRLANFPHFSVDFAHRMCHLQTQSQGGHRDDVIAFFVRFQDQLIYGTDLMFFKDELSDEEVRAKAAEVWRSDWRFLVTDDFMTSPDVRGPFQGLALDRSILEKVYYANAAAKYKLELS